MTEPIQQQLLGHLLGALDDDEYARVDARLEYDEEYCRELARWRQRLGRLEAMRPDFEPPPGLAERTCRYVAECISLIDSSPDWGPWRRMRPLPTPPGQINYLGWLDMAVLALLLMTVGSLIFPAIDNSRFQARLATCQDSLRQFGLALDQYGARHQTALGRLADNGRLTAAGLAAAGSLPEGYLGDSRRAARPNAWLAIQDAWRGHASNETQLAILQRPATAVAGIGVRLAPEPPSGGVQTVDDPYDNWPGTWRDGTTNRRRPLPSPAEVPLLADAPSADLPGQGYLGHDGRGRNVLFEDGHIGFLPNAVPPDSAEGLLSHDEDSVMAGVSVPVVLVSGH
jgi:hypothetical protein